MIKGGIFGTSVVFKYERFRVDALDAYVERFIGGMVESTDRSMAKPMY